MPQPQNASNFGFLAPDTKVQSAVQSAIDLGTIEQFRQVSGSVTRIDQSAYYRIKTMGGRLGVELANLSSDADLEVFDSAFRLLGVSRQSGNLNDWVTLEGLAAGTYYVHVSQQFGDANYQLSLMGNAMPPGDPRSTDRNNTIATATNLGELGSTLTVDGYVGFGDVVDYYQFLVPEGMDLKITMTGLSQDLDLRLFQDTNRNLAIDETDWLLNSTRALNTSETLEVQPVAPGRYYLQVYPAGNVSSSYRLTLQPKFVPKFDRFTIVDASGDDTALEVFDQGTLKVNYRLLNQPIDNPLKGIKIQTLNNNKTIDLANWIVNTQDNGFINLKNITNLPSGTYQIRAIATFQNGETVVSESRSVMIKPWTAVVGTLNAERLDVPVRSGTNNNNAVIWGKGGTDTLNLGVLSTEVLSFNGRSQPQWQSRAGIPSQAIFAGTAFDYLRLQNGQEFYFQGIENLQFLDRQIELQVRTNDPDFARQWNLQVSDVGTAWRFTQGSPQVLLVSLDTGILTAPNGVGGLEDLDLTRLITDPTDDDNYNDSGHGHRAISILAATANNQKGIAGINWNSNVMVHDLYGGGKPDGSRVTFHQAIRQTLQYARSNKLKVVFQGGLQGEYWLTDGGTQAELEQMIRESADIAFYAIASGNGNVDLDITDKFNNAVQVGTSGGVARLQGRYQNVASVGAASPTELRSVNGLINASSVERAGYSNYGKNLTLVAATNVPAVDKEGDRVTFGGTSAANPNLAAIASLVWSMNLNLTAVEVRQILIETAMDIGEVGRDDWTGFGLVNADAAVRRALALGRDRELAMI
jgi:serine protease